MPPTLPPTVAVPTGFHIDFAAIESALEAVAKFLPIVGAFLPPQFKPVLAAVPIAEGILKMIADIQTTVNAGAPGGDVANVVANHLHAIGDNIKALISQHGLTTSLQPTVPMAASESMTPAQIVAAIQASPLGQSQNTQG